MAQKPKLALRTKLLLALVAVVLISVTAVGLLSKVFAPLPPEQPIAFSHRVHAGEKKIDCLYCHTAARRSTTAGLPSVERCMGCHSLIATRRPEIRKLADFWEKREPVPWVRVHRLPDFVYFSHKRHVAAGVRCQECHGPVETMDVVYQYASLEMGWCLSCHKQDPPAPSGAEGPPGARGVTGATVFEGAFPNDVPRTTRASLDCATCHK
jgi:hypothetical protein